MKNELIETMVESTEKAAHAIVDKMIDAGFIESEPEAEMWEYEINTIIRNKFGY